MTTIMAWILGPIGRYVLIGIAGIAFMGWIRADARAPYQEEIAELKKAAADREKLEADDKRIAEANAIKAAKLQVELERLINAQSSTACKFSDDELKRLRDLAGAG